jgi:hypothetical protein
MHPYTPSIGRERPQRPHTPSLFNILREKKKQKTKKKQQRLRRSSVFDRNFKPSPPRQRPLDQNKPLSCTNSDDSLNPRPLFLTFDGDHGVPFFLDR